MTLRTAWGLVLLLCTACAEPVAPAPPVGVEARRVVTLAPSLTEVVLALGGAGRLVGVTRFDDAPEVREVTRVGGFNDPSVETLLALRPDLVLAQPSPGNRGAVDALQRRGIPVLVLPLERSVAGVRDTIRTVAARIGAEKQSISLIDGLDQALARARERASRRPRKPNVAVLFGLAPLVAGGPGSFVHDLLAVSGATNAIQPSAQDYPHVAPTTLLAADPPVDALLLAGLDLHGAGGDTLPAGLAQRARALHSKGFLQPGPRVVEALDELGAILDRLAAPEAP